MKTPDNDSGEHGFDSLNCVLFLDDGPGDTTIKPCPPHLFPALSAEREKLIRWGALPAENKADPSD